MVSVAFVLFLSLLYFFGVSLNRLHVTYISFYFSLGVESSLSMDEVLRKRYRGKLEFREVDMFNRLCPPRRVDRLNTPTPPVPPVGSSASEGGPLLARSISSVMPTGSAPSPSPEDGEDIKEGIIADVRQIQAKRKAM